MGRNTDFLIVFFFFLLRPSNVFFHLLLFQLVKDTIEWHKIGVLSIIIRKTFAWKKNLRFKFCMAKSPVLQRCIFLKFFAFASIIRSVNSLISLGARQFYSSPTVPAKVLRLFNSRQHVCPHFQIILVFLLCEKKLTMKTCMLIRGWKDEQILSKLHNPLKSYSRNKFSTRKVSHRSDRYTCTIVVANSVGFNGDCLGQIPERLDLYSVHACTMHVKSWYISEQKWPNLSWHFIHLYTTNVLNHRTSVANSWPMHFCAG